MAVDYNRQYIGARYVPKLFNGVDGSMEWQENIFYEPLTIVTYNNSQYTSKRPVPNNIGNPTENPQYWALTGQFNAQLNTLINDVSKLNVLSFYVTPQMYKTADVDWGECINKCLESNKDVFIPEGTYNIMTPISINKPLGGVLIGYNAIIEYNGEGSAIEIQNTHKFTLELLRINAQNGTGVQINGISASNYCQYLNFKIHTMRCNTCFDISTTSTGWVNEMTFNNINFTGTTGLQINSTAGGEAESYTFNDCSCEGITLLLKISTSTEQPYTRNLSFNNMRLEESVGKIIEASGNIVDIYMEGWTSYTPNQIKDMITLPSSARQCIFNFHSFEVVYNYDTFVNYVPAMVDGGKAINNVDLNEIVRPGRYNVVRFADLSSILNKPSNNLFSLIVTTIGPGFGYGPVGNEYYVGQIAIMSDGEFFYRAILNNGVTTTIQPWKSLLPKP